MGQIKRVLSFSKRMMRCLGKEGWHVFCYKLNHRLHKKNEYDMWMLQNEQQYKEPEQELEYKPLISVVVPVYNVEPQMLTACIQSVQNQTYDNWELCLVDDCSTDARVRETLRQFEGVERIKIKYRSENGHISRTTNDGIAMAEGEFVALLDCDDLYAENALYEIVSCLNKDRKTDVLYTDEDKVTTDLDEYFSPNFKPDFNLDMLRANNYICHFFVAKKALIESVGKFRAEYNGAQDYDLILRCTEQAERISHVAKILYHWRVHKESTADNPLSKMYAYEAGKKAIEDHLRRCHTKGEVLQTENLGFYRVKYPVTGNPLVSILIPNKDQAEEKFKEVQQAYEQIMKEREYGGSASGNGYGSYGNYGGFGGYGSAGSSTYQDEESMRRRAASNYVQSGHYQEAMNVLNSLGQKNGEWYYLAAMANMGLGNNVTALDQIREAVRQEPDNVQYRMILQRMEGGGGWYQQQQDPFGGMPTAGGDMCDACCRTMACAMCWPGGIFCC